MSTRRDVTAMTHHAEFEPQAILSGEESALRPKKNGVHLGRGGDANPLIYNMVNDYLDVKKAVKKAHNTSGDDPEAHAAREAFMDSYLEQRRTHIVDYVDFAIETDAHTEDEKLMRRASDIGSRYADLYVSREIVRARLNRAKAMASSVLRQVMTGKLLTEHPGHITIEPGAELESDATIAFVDVVKNGFKLSAKALRKLKDAPAIHSAEISLPVTQIPDDDRALLDDPVHREEVTETIHHIKPW